jgi:hypothetical protein
MRFPPIATYDSGRTPDGTETLPTITPASIDLVALAAALGSEETAGQVRGGKREEARHLADLQQALETASARITALEAEIEALRSSEGRAAEGTIGAGRPDRSARRSSSAAGEEHVGRTEAAIARSGNRAKRSRGAIGGAASPGGAETAQRARPARPGPVHLGAGGNPRPIEAERGDTSMPDARSARPGVRRGG